MQEPELRGFLASMDSAEGVFETVRVSDGAPEYLDYHLRRLSEGAEFINAEVPDLDYGFLVKRLAQENVINSPVARLKIILYIGSDGKNHFCLVLEPYDMPPKSGYSSGVQLISAMHPCCESMLAKIKCTKRKPYSRLRDMSIEKGFFDCMLTDRRGVITETTICSLFFMIDGKFYTPPSDCDRLRGVMEQVVKEELDAMGYKVEEKEFRSKNICCETGIFMTNSLVGVLPVKSINRTTLKSISKEREVQSLIGKFSPYSVLDSV